MNDDEKVLPNEAGSDAKVQEFMKWAFGSDYEKIQSTHELMCAWNKLHKDSFELIPESMVIKFLMNIVELYHNK